MGFERYPAQDLVRALCAAKRNGRLRSPWNSTPTKAAEERGSERHTWWSPGSVRGASGRRGAAQTRREEGKTKNHLRLERFHLQFHLGPLRALAAEPPPPEPPARVAADETRRALLPLGARARILRTHFSHLRLKRRRLRPLRLLFGRPLRPQRVEGETVGATAEDALQPRGGEALPLLKLLFVRRAHRSNQRSKARLLHPEVFTLRGKGTGTRAPEVASDVRLHPRRRRLEARAREVFLGTPHVGHHRRKVGGV